MTEDPTPPCVPCRIPVTIPCLVGLGGRPEVELMNTGDIDPYPRRRDIRTGAADPVPPTGMIPVVPIVEAPPRDPMPTRKELRRGMLPVFPAPGEVSLKAAAKDQPQPRRRVPWLAAGALA